MELTTERLKMLEIMMRLSIDRASRAFSKILRAGARITLSRIYVSDINEATEKMNDDTREMTGIMVNFKGNVDCKLLFMLPLDGVTLLTDLYLRQPEGTTTEFDSFTESVAQELGNVIASHFSNTLVSDFNATLLPEPPIVHNDYAGVIFANLVMEHAMHSDQLLLVETVFDVLKVKINCYLFILPEVASFEKLIDAIGEHK